MNCAGGGPVCWVLSVNNSTAENMILIITTVSHFSPRSRKQHFFQALLRENKFEVDFKEEGGLLTSREKGVKIYVQLPKQCLKIISKPE